MSGTIGQLVKTTAGTFAIVCSDGNGPVGEGKSNCVSLMPVSASMASSVKELKKGWWLVRVNRLLAAWVDSNEESTDAVRAVVGHPNSKYLGLKLVLGPQSRAGSSYPAGDGYIGVRRGGASSPGGWTAIWFDGN